MGASSLRSLRKAAATAANGSNSPAGTGTGAANAMIEKVAQSESFLSPNRRNLPHLLLSQSKSS